MVGQVAATLADYTAAASLADWTAVAPMWAEVHRLVEHGAASAVSPAGSAAVRAEGIGWEVFLMAGEKDTIPVDPAGSAAVDPHQEN